MRNLYQTGKLAQSVREMDSYKIELLGVSETRWTGSGQMQLASGYHMLYSGRQDDHHSRGVAIITSNEMHKSLLKSKPVSERIISARCKSAFAKLTTVIQGMIENSEEQKKDAFYDRLQKTVDETPSHDVLLFMGDLIAKIGRDNRGKERITGQQGLNKGIINGERLGAFCQENNLVIKVPSSFTRISTKQLVIARWSY